MADLLPEDLRALLFGLPPYEREGAPEPELMVDLADALPDELLEQAIVFIEHLSFITEGLRRRILKTLLSHLPATGTEYEDHLASLVWRFPELAARVPEASIPDSIAHIRQEYYWNRPIQALIALAARLPITQGQEFLLAEVRDLPPQLDYYQQKYLAALLAGWPGAIPYSAAKPLLALAHSIEDPEERIRALLTLTPSLPSSEKLEVWREVRENASFIKWPQGLAALSLQLPEPDRQQLGQEALSLAREIPDEHMRLLTLGDLASILEGPLREQIVTEIQALTLDTQTAADLAPFLSKTQMTELVKTLPDLCHGFFGLILDTLDRILPFLKPDELTLAYQVMMKSSSPAWDRNRSLMMIHRYLLDHFPEAVPPFFSQDSLYRQVLLLRRMAPVFLKQLPDQERLALFQEILDRIEGGYHGGAPPPEEILDESELVQAAPTGSEKEVAHQIKARGRVSKFIDFFRNIVRGGPFLYKEEVEEKDLEPEKPVAEMERPPRYADFVFYTDDNARLSNGCPLKISDWYRLEISVRIKTVGIPSKEERRPIREPIKEPNQKQNVTVFVAIEGECFEIEEPVQSLILPPLGDSEKNAWFRLKPLKKSTSLDDLAELSVCLYYEFNLLEEAIISAEVVGKHDDAQSRLGLAAPIIFKQKRVEREYSDFDDVVPRVMHIDLTKSETHFKFNFLFYNKQQQKVIFPAPVRLPETELEHELTKIRDLWYAVAMSPGYIEGLEGKPAEFDTHVYNLARAGSRLWALIFKRDVGSSLFQVGEWLEQNPLPADSLIQVSLDNKAADFIFPWGLLYDRAVPREENKHTLDKQGFWGLRYCIEQQPPEVKRLPDRPIQDNDPLRLRFMLWKSFPNAGEEISFLEELAARSVGKVEINFPPITNADECLKILKDCRENILYFYAHGHTENCSISPAMSLWLHDFLKQYEKLPESSPEREKFRPLCESLSEPEQPSYIKLTNGRLVLDDLYRDVRQFPSHPFVFLNMCESAQVTPSLTKSFVHFFLNRGACAVLGTECPMTVEFAHPFAKAYLTGILAGEAAGPMLLKARRQFMDQLNPLGLAYSLYGPATMNFQPPCCPLPVPEETDGSGTNPHTGA